MLLMFSLGSTDPSNCRESARILSLLNGIVSKNVIEKVSEFREVSEKNRGILRGESRRNHVIFIFRLDMSF